MTFVIHSWLTVCVGIALYSLLTLPRWLFSAINRSCLWALRDQVYDARLRGHLPDCEAVAQFLQRIEAVIIVAPEISATQLWWLQRRLSLADISDKQSVFLRDPSMSDREGWNFALFQHELARIITRQYLTGSWSGLLLVAPFRLNVLRRAIRGTRLSISEPPTEWSRFRSNGRSAASPGRGEKIFNHIAEDETSAGSGEKRLRQLEAEREIALKVEDALCHLVLTHDDNDLVDAV